MGTWSTTRAPRHRPNRATESTWGSTNAKRAHDRIQFSGKASIVAGDRRIRSSTGDLSEAGAYVHTSMPPEMGESVLFTVRLDDGLTLATEATVVWIDRNAEGDPVGCGLAFVRLSPTTREALRARLRPPVVATPVMVEEVAYEQTVAGLLTRFVQRIAG